MNGLQVNTPSNTNGSASRSWLRALELTAPIWRRRECIMATVIEELAARHGDAPALLSDRECFTYSELARRSNQYAHWALEQGVTKGDVVGLMMNGRPDYFAIWVGISSIGATVALLNTNLLGPSLSHCINLVEPSHLIVADNLTEHLTTALANLSAVPDIWIHGGRGSRFRCIDDEVQRQPCGRLDGGARAGVTVEDRALFIYTSGTTGLPKAANVSHGRVMQWSHWFAGMMDMQPEDRMYNCLPMYHSIGGVLVPGAALVGGGSVVLQEKFSASQFWSDVARWDCTVFQYIGEFCRYLLQSAPSSSDLDHRVRLACGNGLAHDIWEAFQTRFGIPKILEFYASTEGGVSLFNVEGKQGAIGRVPPYLAHRFSPALVCFDVETNELARNADGLCIRCSSNEPGEAIGRLAGDASNMGSRFEGYTDDEASKKKIARDVFERGDAWVRTGDLMRKDEKGFYYFVDRIGDTFRWKGENVATSEVSEAICAFPGVMHAVAYGVRIPGAEGRAGMAAIATDRELDLSALWKHLHCRLPHYASPIFLRICHDVEVTGTFKYARTDLAREAYDPAVTADAIYFHDGELESFIRVDHALYEHIQAGQVRC
ncbi:MAG: long-chain-acyl-CoA synthetase [Terracidiphilus sp.]